MNPPSLSAGVADVGDPPPELLRGEHLRRVARVVRGLAGHDGAGRLDGAGRAARVHARRTPVRHGAQRRGLQARQRHQQGHQPEGTHHIGVREI